MADGVEVKEIHRRIARDGIFLQLKVHTGKTFEELDKDMQSFIEWQVEVKASDLARELMLQRILHDIKYLKIS